MTHSSPGPAARPLSPHVSVWRWHVTMFTSIAHRATGLALYVGALILAGWCVALAAGPDAYEAYKGLLGSLLGKLVLFGLTVSVFYHFAAGVRHLAWDVGQGYQPKTANLGSWICIGFGMVAAIAVWVLAALTGVL